MQASGCFVAGGFWNQQTLSDHQPPPLATKHDQLDVNEKPGEGGGGMNHTLKQEAPIV